MKKTKKMNKKYVIKNTENNKYFTEDYCCFWSLDIKDAHTYLNDEEIEKSIKKATDNEDYDDSFNGVNYILIETVYSIKY
jgi:hypothetical protein